jgi:cytochrome b-561 domain-containing protein 2
VIPDLSTTLEMVFHLITAGLTAVILYTAVPGSDLFSWHPTLMTIAFCLLMAQAIVIFSPESSLLQTSSRADKIQLHWILNTFSVVAAAGGFGAIYLNKEVAGKAHFTTWHSKFGLAACIGVLVSALGGIAAKYSSSLKSYVRPINIKLYHATLALVVFGLAMTAMSLACYSNWFQKRVEGYVWRCCFWSPIILLVCVARQVTQSYLPRVAKPSTPSTAAKVAKAELVRKKKEKVQ